MADPERVESGMTTERVGWPRSAAHVGWYRNGLAPGPRATDQWNTGCRTALRVRVCVGVVCACVYKFVCCGIWVQARVWLLVLLEGWGAATSHSWGLSDLRLHPTHTNTQHTFDASVTVYRTDILE